MRIGLLETDILYDDFIKEYGSYGLMFENYFGQLDNSKIEFVYYQVQQGALPLFFDECDAYIVTGSKTGAYENQTWIKALSNWIIEAHQAETKILGICFGHQIIAQALGGIVEMSDKGWGVGVRSLLTTPNSPFSQPLPKYLDLIYSHKDQVIALPPEANNFLGDRFCPYAGFTMGQHIVTLQGHPEFSAQYSERLFDFRAEIIGEPTYSKSIRSLRQVTDANFIGRLILDFLRPAKTQLTEKVKTLQEENKKTSSI
ncbi:MAG: GMP synthase-like glutamine amidotransferase [Oleispira sp.]|jgi:GMP synthase-like glutamine amidotransferase